MSCHIVGNTIYCGPNIFKYPYEGVEYIFEWHDYLGPYLVDEENYDPVDHPDEKAKFWEALDEFLKLSKEERKKYLVSD